MAGGWRDLLALVLGWKSSAGDVLAEEQKTLGGEPVVTLTVGGHSLDAFVWGYRYEEKAEDNGGLTLWLVNKADEFDDLSTDYPDLKRGAQIDLRRGLPVGGVDTTEKLPRTWIEGFRYVYLDGTPLLEIQCIDWRERLEKFRYSSQQTWTNTEIATIASSILGQVSLTLATGSFGFSIDFAASPRRAGDQILLDLMRRVDEYLYAGLDGEISHKDLDPSEGAGYVYDWSGGPSPGEGYGNTNHPLMPGSEVAETSARYNHVVVNGSASYTGSASDATEIALVGTRLRTIKDNELTSNAQCTERARGELRFWLGQTIVGTIVARPHFRLRMYDVLSIAAPPWGGGSVVGRVRRIVEEYGRGQGIWQQVIEVGGLAGRAIEASELADASVDAAKVLEGTITADEIAANTITASEIAADSITASEIAADTITAAEIATDAITADEIAANAVTASEILANTITSAEIAANTITAAEIAAGTITAAEILANTITAGEIAADTITAAEIATDAITADEIAANAVTASEMNVSTLSAITADMGTLTAGTIKMGTGTKDVDLDGFQIDSSELVGQNSGVDQVVLSSSDGKITAGAGALILDEDGIQANSGNQDVNKLKIRDGSDTVLALYGEVNDGTGTSGTLECAGKQAADPEGLLEMLAITYNGAAQGGVASVSVTLDTETGDIQVGGANRMTMGTCYFELTEQAADPAAPGVNRGKLYVKDNGSGKTQLCIRFNTGAVQVIATEP
jgi:hypothetical protein